MDTGTAAVLGALITAVGGVLVAIINKFRKENHEDHGRVREALEQVSNTIERVEGKVDSHINWHATGGTNNGRAARRHKSGTRKAS